MDDEREEVDERAEDGEDEPPYCGAAGPYVREDISTMLEKCDAQAFLKGEQEKSAAW